MKRWLRRTLAITLGLTLGWLAAGYTPMVWNAQAQPATLPGSSTESQPTTLPQTAPAPAAETTPTPAPSPQPETAPAQTAPSAAKTSSHPSATQPKAAKTERNESTPAGPVNRPRVVDLGKRAARLMVARGDQLQMVELMLAAGLGLLLLAALVGPWLKASGDASEKEAADHSKSGH